MDSEKTLTVGQTLRQAREHKGASIGDVAAEIMVPQHYLSAIENDQYTALPGQTYAIGFVRNYSRYLCLPASDIVDQLKSEVSFPKTLDTVEIASGFVAPPKQNILPSGASIASGLCVAVGVYGLWFAASATTPTSALPAALPDVVIAPAPAEKVIIKAEMASLAPTMDVAAADVRSQAAAAQAPDAAQAPAAAKPAEKAPVVAAALPKVNEAKPLQSDTADSQPVYVAAASSNVFSAEPVTIHVAEEAWMEIRTNGKIYFSGIKQPGDVLNLPAQTAAVAQLTTGNAGGIWLSVGDWSSQALGQPGRVRRNVALAPSALRANLPQADRS